MHRVITRLAIAGVCAPLLGAVALVGAVTPAAAAAEPTPCGDVEVLAHRGTHNDTVDENTIAAFDATARGGWSVETDVRPDAQGQLWVFHDADPFRATGTSGTFSQMTSAEVGALRYRQSGSPVVSFSALLTWMAEHPEVRTYIEPKQKLLARPGRPTLNVPRQILRRVTNRGFTQRTWITRFREALPADPGIGLDSKPRNVAPDPATLAGDGYDVVTLWPAAMNAENVAAYHAVGIAVHASESVKRWFWRRSIRAGADGIVTDAPGAVLRDCQATFGG